MHEDLVSTLLARLRRTDGPGTAAARLAALLVDEVLARRVGDLVRIDQVVDATRAFARALAESEGAAGWLARLVADVERDLAAEKRMVSQLVPAPLAAGAREIVELPLTVPRDVVTKLLDREPVRKLLRAQVIDTLVAFGRKAASPVADNPIARGIGGLSKRALGQVASKPSALGALASAVSGEVERQVEKRASDFADTALDGILAGIADQLGDPARAKEQAALRLALLEGALELRGTDLAGLTHVPVADAVAIARRALAAWAAAPSFEADVRVPIEKAIAREADRPLGDVLAELGLRDAAAAQARAAIEPRFVELFASEAFAAWLAALAAG